MSIVMYADANIANIDDVKTQFERALHFLFSHMVLGKTAHRIPKPKRSALQGRFQKIVKDRWAENKKKYPSSGVAEDLEELNEM